MTHEALIVTPEMIEAADRANCAAEPNEGWQDETDAYPVIYGAMKALDPERTTLLLKVKELEEALADWRNSWLCPATDFEASVPRLLATTRTALGREL